MSDAAEIKNDKNEKYGLSQLDLVKHSVKTIIYSLCDEDRLSIVSFAYHANIVLSLTKMDDAGKKKAIEAVENLRSSGSTNLWDGLRTGVEHLPKQQDSIKSISALFLLTDGCPTEIPPNGHLISLEKLKKNLNFLCSVNIFGFGYKLDSKLLEDIAVLGNSGSYAFIPDGSFVGTIFVNAISTLLTTTATNVQLLIHDQDAQNTDYMRWYSTYKTEEGTYINLGSITYGQSKDLLIPVSSKLTKECRFTLTYQNAKKTKKSIDFHFMDDLQQADLNLIIRHKTRLEFVQCVRTALENMKSIKTNSKQSKKQHDQVMNELQKFKEKMKLAANGDDDFIKDLLADLTGQVQEAMGKQEWFNKWGVHYLPSLTRAHLLQLCNNIKDPGVQHYGKGEVFSKMRDEMDDIFCSLPAPTSSLATSAPVNMTVFYNAAGGCFYGECTVCLMNGTTKLVKDVQPGDRVAPYGGMVRFVVKTKCPNRKAKMVIVSI
ncbi:unnamed protein product [Rotaria sp. Silwood2]|nr:unnamed protein product [Rotaria sp. Silwood2]